jgi:hypothetical protein
VPVIAAARLYLQVPDPENVNTSVIDRDSLAQELPRIWNSSAAMVEVERKHHGVPLPMLVSIERFPNDAVVHAPPAAVPPKAALTMVASVAAPLFMDRLPVKEAVVHSNRVDPPDLNFRLPMFVAVTQIPGRPVVQVLPVGLRTVPVGSVIVGLVVAEATAGRAKAARATRAKPAVTIFLCMGFPFSMPGAFAGR